MQGVSIQTLLKEVSTNYAICCHTKIRWLSSGEELQHFEYLTSSKIIQESSQSYTMRSGSMTCDPMSLKCHSTRGHPRVSTPPSQSSMKFGIQHLWTNITTQIFYFLHTGSRSVFTALWKLLWMNRGKTTERHCLLQLSIPWKLKALKTSNSPFLFKISWGFQKCGLKLYSTYQCLWNSLVLLNPLELFSVRS
jgi:hypothetical protein